MERYFEAKRRLFIEREPPPAAVNVGDAYGRQLAEELGGSTGAAVTFGFADDAEIRPSSDRGASAAGSTRRAARPLQRRERRSARWRRARCSASPTTRSRRASAASTACPGGSRRSTRASRSRSSSTTAHTPGRARERAPHGARARAGRVICVFGCGGDRDRDKRPLMGRIAVGARRCRDRHLRQPAQRGSAGDHRGDRRRAHGDDVEVEPDRRAAIEPALESRRAGRRRRDRRQGPRAGPGVRGRELPFDDREVAREALRTARSAARDPARARRGRRLARAARTAPGADEVTGVQIDSRRIEPGDLFVAVGGGADFVDDALARGAAATLVPGRRLRRAGGARQRRARSQRGRASSAITGSTGKTSTKDILAALCAPARADGRGRGELQQRARRAADARAGSSRTPRSASPSWRMRGLGQIARAVRDRAAATSA